MWCLFGSTYAFKCIMMLADLLAINIVYYQRYAKHVKRDINSNMHKHSIHIQWSENEIPNSHSDISFKWIFGIIQNEVSCAKFFWQIHYK